MSNGKYQERLNESLSALMDGEISELELQRLLKATAASAELGARWSRYQLAASVLRREQVAPVGSDLAARISTAIEKEPPPKLSVDGGSEDSAGPRWWRRSLIRGAVAATVAVATILGVQQFSSVQQGGVDALIAEAEAPVLQQAQPASQPSGFYVPAPSIRSVSTATPRLVPDDHPSGIAGQAVIQQIPTPELMRHLNRVMMQHSEQAAHVGSQGMVPFVRATYAEQAGM